VSVPDLSDVSFTVEEDGRLHFSGKAEGTEYGFDEELFGKVDVEVHVLQGFVDEDPVFTTDYVMQSTVTLPLPVTFLYVAVVSNVELERVPGALLPFLPQLQLGQSVFSRNAFLPLYCRTASTTCTAARLCSFSRRRTRATGSTSSR
jgi:hypothetical protein